MLVSNNKKTVGGFYNIHRWSMGSNGVMHQERVCSFYDCEDVESFFKGYAIVHGLKVERQVFVSGSICLSIKE